MILTEHDEAVLRLVADEDLHGLLWWRLEGEKARNGGIIVGKRFKWFINTNDLFHWACADAEEITPDNIDALRVAISECEAIDPVCGSITATELWAARINKMRPQNCAYPPEREYWPLFDDCGPERTDDDTKRPEAKA